ncbi:MAG: ABC transporter permease [Blastocatellia bacterium]|nr:ABC transporter permease [Blastocatellia bacterium]
MRRPSVARFTAVAAVLGIAAGIAGALFAQALARGFQTELSGRLLANTPHITVFRKDGLTVNLSGDLVAGVRGLENVDEAEPASTLSGIIIGGGGPEYVSIHSRVGEDDVNSGEVELVLGIELAERLGPSREMELVVLDAAGIPQTHKVRVTGTFSTGLFEYDATWARASQANFARLTGDAEFRPTMINVTLVEVFAAEGTAAEIRSMVGDDFRVITWEETNRPLFAALNLERKAALAVIGLIVLISALNITTTLALLVNERRGDIAVLRTVGASTRALSLVFVIEGLVLGAAGASLGIAAGLAGIAAANYWELISLDREVNLISSVPLIWSAADVAVLAVAAFVIALAASAYPALRAARLKPMENLRIG